MWQNTIGSDRDDIMWSVLQTKDEGYLLGGYSRSYMSEDKSEASEGDDDYWIVKTYADPDCPAGWYFADADGDGYGNLQVFNCGPIPGYVVDYSDCDDSDSSINPLGAEICNGLDDDCNALIDEGLFSTYYVDADGDNFGDINDPGSLYCSNPGAGYTSTNTDCEDTNALINPLAIEICNGLDDDCNLQSDEGLVFLTYYADNDGDGFGNPNNIKISCLVPLGYVDNNTDCNDNNFAVNPDALEIPGNNMDDNCNGDIDEVGVGVSSIEMNEISISIIPNPNRGIFTLKLLFNNKMDADAEMEVRNVLGQIVYSKKIMILNEELVENIVLQKGDNGMHLLTVTINQYLYTISFLVQE
jgi:hypothetical protein